MALARRFAPSFADALRDRPQVGDQRLHGRCVLAELGRARVRDGFKYGHSDSPARAEGAAPNPPTSCPGLTRASPSMFYVLAAWIAGSSLVKPGNDGVGGLRIRAMDVRPFRR